MTTAEQSTVLDGWLDATNSHNVDRYLAFFTEDAVLDDLSVGRTFEGREGIAEYYDAYFIGYQTTTRLVSTEDRDGTLHVEVLFTGTFPGGETGGVFDIRFDGDRIEHIRADLV